MRDCSLGKEIMTSLAGIFLCVSLRSACVKRGMSVVVHDNSVELIGGSSTGDLRVKLPRLEAPQALEELKVLLFTMADNLAQPDTECTKFFHSF